MTMDSEVSTGPMQSSPTERPDRSLRKAGIAFAKKVVPRRLIQEIRRYRRLKKSERFTYLKLRINYELGLDSRKVPSTARSFVFVCFGNIMRSPTAEALFRQASAGLGVRITSAGLNATPGTPAHPWAVAAAEELGISLANHRATLLTPTMIDDAEAILAMDLQNQVELLTRYPDAAAKFFMLGAYSGATSRTVEIRDPFYGDLNETRRCYALLRTCTQNLASSLIASTRTSGGDY